MPKSTMCPKDHDSQLKTIRTIPTTFSRVKAQGSHASLARPVMKKMPLEKSVTNFLDEVENFVSLIEAPWLLLSSKATRERKNNPLTTREVSKSGEESTCALPRLLSHRSNDSDSDDMFTIFEAPSQMKRKPSSRAKSIQQLVQSATNGSLTNHSKSTAAEKDNASLVLKTSMSATKSRSSSPKSLPVDLIPQKTTQLETLISKDVDVEQSGRKERVEAAMPVLLETDTDIVLVTKKSPLRLKSVNEFEPESSLPLDANEFADTHEDFDMFRNGSAPHEANRCSNSSKSRDSIQATINEAKITDLVLPRVRGPDNEPEQQRCEQRKVHGATDSEPSSTTQLVASAPSSTQSVLVQDEVPTTSPDCSAREYNNIYDDNNNSECRETTTCGDAAMSTDTQNCMESASVSSRRSPFCYPELEPDESSSHISRLDDSDSQRFLFRAYTRLVTLLHCSITEQAGAQEEKKKWATRQSIEQAMSSLLK
uniref:Uncharacterized protein n=1 Tax=Physcomitrium patens TaxID=3218 RepID=A9SZV6_PHYPA|nr:hypothetical protein PHYPA_005905 [Physcomitrium patens]